MPRPNFDFWSNIPILMVNFSKTNLFYLNENIRQIYTCPEDENNISPEISKLILVYFKI